MKPRDSQRLRRRSRQMFQVVQVLHSTAGGLVYFQMLQANDVDLDAIHHHSIAGRIASLESDAVDFVQYFKAKRRNTHAKNLASLQEQIGRKLGNPETKRNHDLHHLRRVLGRDFNPDIHVGRGAGIAVMAHRVASDEEIFNAFSIAQFQELFEVAR